MPILDKNDFLAKVPDMGIHDLRTFGRNIGVSSPTTKKREDLIENILDIMDGKIQSKKSNMGRPVKNIKIEDTYETIENNVFSQNKDEPEFDAIEIMKIHNSITLTCASSTSDDIFVNVAGIIKRTNIGNYYFKNLDYSMFNGFVYINEDLVMNNGLDEYYYVSGKAVFIKSKNIASLDCIETINSGDFIYLKSNLKLFHENVLPSEAIPCTDKLEGATYLEEFSSKGELINSFIDNQNKIDNSFYKVNISLNLDSNSKLKIKNSGCNLSISTQLNDSYQSTINTLNDLYNHLELMYNFNEKIVLNIIDVSWMLSNLYDFTEINNIKFEALKIIEKLLNMSACNKDGGSITVIAGYTKDSRFEEEIKKLKYFCS